MQKIRDWLYIGKYSETRNLAILQAHDIDAVLQLADAVQHPDIETKYVAIEDGEPVAHPKIEAALDFIREQKAKGHTLVVACGAGISRSTTIIMAALMEYEDRDLFDAYAQVYEHHPIASPHYKLVMSLADYHGIELDLAQTLDGLREVQHDD